MLRVWKWLRRQVRGNPRHIFTYNVAGKRHAADPLAVWRAFERIGGINWLDTLTPLGVRPFAQMPAEAYEHLHKARQHTVETVAGWVRAVFSLPTFEAGGLTETECLNLLTDFLWAVNELEAEYRPFVISQVRGSPSPSAPTPTTA